ncbi:TPA: FlmC family protein [Escherichia coli]|nr:FlmC family protein [Escherichia coli]
MSSPHQDSLLPRFAQGEEGHETTTKFPCLVCVDRVSHTVDIHLSDTKIAVRDSLQRRTQGGGVTVSFKPSFASLSCFRY